MTERTEFVFNTEGLGRKNDPRPWRGESGLVRTMAQVVSYIFHPLFIPLYVAAYLLFIHPYAFAGVDHKIRVMRLITVGVSTFLLPAFSVFLLWRLNFTSSILLRTQKERIIPYAIAIIFYFWVWYVFHNLNDSSPAIQQFLLGSFLAVCSAWMANIAFKISMHGTAVGGLLGFFLLHGWTDSDIGGAWLSIALVIAGLVCTARLIVSDHNARDVYIGLIVGIITQALGLYFA